MRLTIVGCSGSFPGPDSAASSYLLEAPHEGRTFSLVLDLGNGALGALQRHIEPGDVDAIALSHLHSDHCIDLCAMYVVRKYHPAGAMPPIPVHGPTGTAGRLARAYDLPEDPGMTNEFDFHDWSGGVPTQIGPFVVTVARVDHPVEAYAVRVEHEDTALVYSGDTGASRTLVDLATGADVLLCEASFVESADNPPHVHLTGAQAGAHAAQAGVGRLLLTHVPPWIDAAEVAAEAKRTFDGPSELVVPGAQYDL